MLNRIGKLEFSKQRNVVGGKVGVRKAMDGLDVFLVAFAEKPGAHESVTREPQIVDDPRKVYKQEDTPSAKETDQHVAAAIVGVPQV